MSETIKRKAIEIPLSLRSRPIYNGYIVPWFVSWYVGDRQVNENEPGARPSFPTIDIGRLHTCRKFNKCWICGAKLGTYKAFVFGPASAISATSMEPPSHRDCARYAVQVCPHLINENARYTLDRGNYRMKEGEEQMPGISPEHPGLIVIYIVKMYGFRMQDRARGLGIFELPFEPESIEFWYEGHKATIEQAANAIQRAVTRHGLMSNDNPARNRELAWRIKGLMEMAS